MVIESYPEKNISVLLRVDGEGPLVVKRAMVEYRI